MNDNLKIAFGVLLYIVCFGLSIIWLAEPAGASDFNSNYDRIPLIHNAPPQVANWSLTPTVIVCEHAPVNQRQIIKADITSINIVQKSDRRIAADVELNYQD